MMFAGLRSRWTTPRVCANSIARQTSANARSRRWRVNVRRASASPGELRGARSSSVAPASRFITKYGWPSVVAHELVDRHDRRVLEPALDPRLAQEPRDALRRRRRATRIRLIATVAADLLVVRRDDLAHAAAAEHLAELVAHEQLAGRGSR